MIRPPRHNQRGLTLMEITLAVAILAIMATITWGSVGKAFDAYETVTDIDARYHNVRNAMNRMAKELSMAFISAPDRDFNVDHPEQSWKTIFRAKKASPFYELNFASFSHQILRQDAKESDQSEIGYYGEPDADDHAKYNLMRREDPRIDYQPDKGGRSEVLAENVKDFKLRFFDTKEDDWVDEWDTEKADHLLKLPLFVEISLTIEGEDGKDITFFTKTMINMPLPLRRQ